MVYKWGYSLDEIIDLYMDKELDYAKKRTNDYKFVVSVAKGVMGIKDEPDKITKQEFDDIPDEKKLAMQKMLGGDYGNVVNN